MRRLLLPLLSAGLAGACLARGPSVPAGGDHETLALVETAPVGTTLAHGDLAATHEVWEEMVAGARKRIDLAHFYASNRPGSRLEPVIAALEAAADRGVTVRFLADARFHDTYPATLDRLAARKGIEVRLLDLGPVTGGVLHAKLLIADDRVTCLSSANFDWRSLEHIQELGVRIDSTHLAADFEGIFAHDWALAGGQEAGSPLPRMRPPRLVTLPDGQHARVRVVASPRALVADEASWDLPHLVTLLDGAHRTAFVQLLSFDTLARDGERFGVLEDALRRAAARGVDVRLLLADWCKRAGTIEGLQSLQRVEGLEVRLVSLPESAEGFIPYARVVHAKYLVVDERRAWVGTSNWSRDYFLASRNVGVLVDGASFATRLARFFRDGWESPYASPVDPTAHYEPPRVGE